MSSWFENFQDTDTGRALGYIINRPDRIMEFRLLSNLGIAAVQAVAHEVTPIIEALPDKSSKDKASQFTGWLVAKRMRAAGYEIVQARGRVSDAPFKTGAVWRRTRRLQVLDRPGPVTEGGMVELGVQHNSDGDVIGRWRMSMTAVPGRLALHEMKGFDMPIESAFRDAVEYADRYGFSTLCLHDPEELFPREKWMQILQEMDR